MDAREAKHQATYNLLKFLLPMIGFERQPITTLSIIYRHRDGCHIGYNGAHIWYNYEHRMI